MITKIKNSEGKDCYAILFDEHFSLEEVPLIQRAIIWAVRASAQSDLFDVIKDDVAMLMELLEYTLLAPNQMFDCEKVLFPKDK